VSKSIIYNTAFASLERAVTILSYLLLLPFMLKYLGETVYGIWVVFNLVGS